MQHSWLLVLVVVLLAVSPLPATAYIFECGDAVYAANSTYEANLRRLEAILQAETFSSPFHNTFRGVGYWPYRVRAFSRCHPSGSANTTSSCAACIAGAFREAERACPYGKKVVIFARDCSLSLADFPSSVALGSLGYFDMLAPVMVLQAIGCAWLLFLLLQEWRVSRRGSMMRHSSIPSGDP